MSTKYGILQSCDNDFAFISGAGREVLYAWVQAAFAEHNEELAAQQAFFVERQTVAREIRYASVVGGFAQTLGRQAAPEAVKRGGSWTVGLPLYSTGDQLAFDKVDWSHMRAGEFESHVVSIMERDKNSRRHAILSAIFSNTPRVFYDMDYQANVTVEPLANNDAVLYPPIIGSAIGAPDAVENHYIVATPVNAANFAAFIDEVLEHYDWTQGGDNLMVLCHPTEAAIIAALAGFNAYADRYTTPNVAATWTQNAIPSSPGLTIGRYQGVWINEWRAMPEHYLYCQHLDFPAPLLERIEDPSVMTSGLSLAAIVENYPITSWMYDDRYGYGVGNRLNGCVWYVGTGLYVIPNFVSFPYAT